MVVVVFRYRNLWCLETRNNNGLRCGIFKENWIQQRHFEELWEVVERACVRVCLCHTTHPIRKVNVDVE